LFRPIDEGDDDLTIARLRGAFDENEITATDVILDHRIATHLQRMFPLSRRNRRN
jgi:hypothetical protein